MSSLDSSCTGLYKSAITHADAVVKCSDEIDPEVASFIKKQKGKVVLDHNEQEGYVEDYIKLYDNLLERQN